MKLRYLVTAFLLSTSCLAQSKINGIGPFKIGKTTIGIVNQIAQESGDSLRSYDSNYYLDEGRLRIIELISNKADLSKSPTAVLFSPNTRVFLVSTYRVAGIDLNNLYLTFKGDQLARIACSGAEKLTDALLTKYGEVPIKTTKTKSVCVYKSTGNKLDIVDATYIRRWVNGTVIAEDYTSKIYNSNCKEEYTALFSVTDKLVYSTMLQAHAATLKKIKQSRAAQKKSVLSEF